MNVLLIGDFDAEARGRWLQALGTALPEATWLDEAGARARPEAVQAAVVANPPPGSLQGLPRLRDPEPVGRRRPPVGRRHAAGWRATGTHGRPFDERRLGRNRAVDRAVAASRLHCLCPASARSSLAGARPVPRRRGDRAGAGPRRDGPRHTAARLAQQGYAGTGWRRDGAPLPPLLKRAHIAVNLLPLTPDTQGLLDAAFFAALPPRCRRGRAS